MLIIFNDDYYCKKNILFYSNKPELVIYFFTGMLHRQYRYQKIPGTF